MNAASLAPDRLVAYLTEAGVDHEFVAPGVPMPTVPMAAAAIGVEERQILKTLLFTDGKGGFVVAVACGPARLDRKAVAAASGLSKATMADAETVLRLTGFPAGGVAPVGHATLLPVVIDAAVMDLPAAWGGGGDEQLLLRLAPVDIARLTGATIAAIQAAPETIPPGP
jgi:Cys-tRNA(Pro) deacylase